MKDPAGLPNHPNLTPAEISAFLKVSRTVIYDMLQRGELPRGRVRDQWRIPRDKFIDWWEEQQKNLERMSA